MTDPRYIEAPFSVRSPQWFDPYRYESQESLGNWCSARSPLSKYQYRDFRVRRPLTNLLKRHARTVHHDDVLLHDVGDYRDMSVTLKIIPTMIY